VRKGKEGTVTNHYNINQDYYFIVPEDFPLKDNINDTGNREFYISYSPVKIIGVKASVLVTP
ncbi:uncharacterized protein K441DRAFT_560754, partial [Cenococcum geophilum 1.58]|uniref:uncharacterized protein n=1 Tax=Cenococcum geophilum 1.58 TaxID=794803 RepID=UPI003590064E